MHKVRIFTLALIISLLLSVAGPLTVYADDSQPPATPVAESLGDDGADSGVTETNEDVPADDPEAADGINSSEGEVDETGETTTEVGEDENTPGTVDGETLPQDGDSGEAEAPQEQPILEQIPDNTEIIILNEEGESESMVTEDAIDTIENSDPVWCPQGQPPTPGQNGCTDSFSSFDDLLRFLEENEDDPAFRQAGAIYFEEGAYSGDETVIDFNDYDFDEFRNYDITLKGGWDTETDVVDENKKTTFHARIVIGSIDNPWAGTVSIENISITDTDGAGLVIITEQDANIYNSDFNDNGSGFEIKAGGNVEVDAVNANGNNIFGGSIEAVGDVNVFNSAFNNNRSGRADGAGLEILSGGNVFIDNVNASGNERFGADISAANSVAIYESVFSNNGALLCNCGGYQVYGYGLRVDAGTSIDIDSVEANNNYVYGASLTSSEELVYIGYSTFNNNGFQRGSEVTGFGLEIVGDTEVILENVEARDNNLFGANIEAAGSVVVTNSVFSGNQSYLYYKCKGKEALGYGLKIVAVGDVDLDGVEANDNNLFGADIETTGHVSIQNSTFSNNGFKYGSTVTGYGLKINTIGHVSMNGVEANNNNLFGADIETLGHIAISNSTFSGNHSYLCNKCSSKEALGYGLKIVTIGNVSLQDVEANNNYLFGADIETVGNVFIKRSTFNNNGFQHGSTVTGYGLKIQTIGDVDLDTVEANNNKLFGADIDTIGDVAIANSIFSGNQSYTYAKCGCSGSSSSSSNGFLTTSKANCHDSSCWCKEALGYGLKVVTIGDVDLDLVEANDNNLFGADIETVGDVAISDSVFSSNGFQYGDTLTGYGLKIKTVGDVILSEVEANDNNLFGADIETIGDVAIAKSVFSGNQSYTYAKCGCSGSSSSSSNGFLTTSKANCHDNNWCKQAYGYGLKVVTVGDVDLYKVTAEENNLFGADIETIGDVNVANSVFSNNSFKYDNTVTGYGLKVKTEGNVDLYEVEANNNNLFGADIETTGKVVVTNSIFSGNQSYLYYKCQGKQALGYGLRVVTVGDVELSGITADENYLFGVDIKTDGNVAVTNSSFSGNAFQYGSTVTGYGIQIDSGGDVLLDYVQANNNNLFGGNITAAGSVSVYESSFSDNQAYTCSHCSYNVFGYGLEITAGGDIDMDSVEANNNYLHGAKLTSDGFIYVGFSTFSNNGFEASKKVNTGAGLIIDGGSEVILENVTANHNELFGANIEAAGDVLVINSTFSGNKTVYHNSCRCTSGTGYGIKVVSHGEITMEGTSASDNYEYGAKLETDQGAITISDSTFNNNLKGPGIWIKTDGGNVELNNVTATNNGSDGVRIDGVSCTNVSVTDGQFSDNDGYGVNASNSIVTLNGAPVFANNTKGDLNQDNCQPQQTNTGRWNPFIGAYWWRFGKIWYW
ncbi:MAG: right-handed parallel beta-helix repeat-containing protein [Anaerolineales bacterium]|nr:right-handed parallel beta-helix repeat-containing protein [Anaerolineales bacterium]